MKHVVIILGVVALLMLFFTQNMHRVSPSDQAIGGTFDLIDVMREKVTNADFSGQYMLVFFGFTHCPEICPNALTTLSHVEEVMTPLLAQSDKKLTYVFITVDPERDTVDEIREYMGNFSDKIVGLTGTRQQIDQAMQSYGVFADKIDMPQMDTYMYNHSSYVYLMSPEGQYLGHFMHNLSVDDMHKEIMNKLGI